MLLALTTNFKKELSLSLLVNVDHREWYETNRMPAKNLTAFDKQITRIFLPLLEATSPGGKKKVEEVFTTLNVACWSAMNVPFPVSAEAHALRVFENLVTILDDRVKELEEVTPESAE